VSNTLVVQMRVTTNYHRLGYSPIQFHLPLARFGL
jgi:hypothetical protein